MARIGLLLAFLVACGGKAAPRQTDTYKGSGDDSMETPTGTPPPKTGGKTPPKGTNTSTGPTSSTGPKGTTGTHTSTGVTEGNADGSWENPYIVSNFPATLAKDTSKSAESQVDSYTCYAEDEKGPEVVYKLVPTQDGTLTVSYSEENANGVDIDVFLLDGITGNKCLKGDNNTITAQVQSGKTYYLSFDSWSNAVQAYPGAFSATVTFTH